MNKEIVRRRHIGRVVVIEAERERFHWDAARGGKSLGNWRDGVKMEIHKIQEKLRKERRKPEIETSEQETERGVRLKRKNRDKEEKKSQLNTNKGKDKWRG